MTTVACVGIVVRDIIFTVEALPSGAGKVHAYARNDHSGGPAANAAVAIARLGGKARFIGPVGDDPLGDELVEELEQEGVDTSRARRVHGASSPLSAVAVDREGERSIVNYSDDRLFGAAAGVEEADLVGADAVLCDVRWGAGTRNALAWAREADVPGIVDFDIGKEASADLLDLASHVIFSEAALRRHTGIAESVRALESLAAHHTAWLAVTVGAQGTFWINGDATRHSPAFPVDAVDTVGAGDVYHGVFALRLAEGSMELPEIIRHASAAAALSCLKEGGGSSAPDTTTLASFMERGT